MKTQNGFAPAIVLLIIGALSAAVFAGKSYFKPTPVEKEEISGYTVLPTYTPSPHQTKPTGIPLPTKKAVMPTPNSPDISFYIIDNNYLPITDASLFLSVKNEDTGFEQQIQNKSAAWFFTGLEPGKYKVWISYPLAKYETMEKSCTGCEDKQDVAALDSCGYYFRFQSGSHVKISCKLMTFKALAYPINDNIQTAVPDNSQPLLNISKPWGTTYGTAPVDNFCFLLKGNDDVPTTDTEFSYRTKIDQGPWSDWNHNPYPCFNKLNQGSHVFSAQVMDKSGKTSDEKSIAFEMR